MPDIFLAVSTRKSLSGVCFFGNIGNKAETLKPMEFLLDTYLCFRIVSESIMKRAILKLSCFRIVSESFSPRAVMVYQGQESAIRKHRKHTGNRIASQNGLFPFLFPNLLKLISFPVSEF